jgi:hypothetical protein
MMGPSFEHAVGFGARSICALANGARVVLSSAALKVRGGGSGRGPGCWHR